MPEKGFLDRLLDPVGTIRETVEVTRDLFTENDPATAVRHIGGAVRDEVEPHVSAAVDRGRELAGDARDAGSQFLARIQGKAKELNGGMAYLREVYQEKGIEGVREVLRTAGIEVSDKALGQIQTLFTAGQERVSSLRDRLSEAQQPAQDQGGQTPRAPISSIVRGGGRE